jgi:hypothetical protein
LTNELNKGAGADSETESKKRSRKETVGAPENQIIQRFMNPTGGGEEQYAYKIENMYKVQGIIEGFNVHVLQVKTSYELELDLKKLKP